MLITNHKETLEYPPEKSIRQIVQEMAEIQKKYFDLKGRYGGIHTQIDKAEDAQERQTKLFSSLRVAGLELYQMQNGRHECPLCGTDGITQSKLLAHLEAESTQADQQLQALYLQRDDLEREIATAASELKRLDQQQATALKYKDALSQLQQEFPDLNNFSDLSQQHEFAMEQQESFQVKTTQAKKALMEKLREIGSDYTIEDVLNCKHRLFDLTLSANLVLPLKESNESFLEHLAQIKEDGRIQKEKNAEVLRQTRELRNRQVQAAQSCRTELEQIRNWLGQIEIELTQLVRLETFWERIHDVTDNADLTGEAVQSVCEHICKLARSVIDYTQYIESKESYLCSKEMLEQKLRRCYVLKKELESLKPPDFYADQFIRQNIAQISQIFLTLHSPQEFSRLDITEDNKLAAFRNKVAVPVSHMSTGQRTALVVATFFQMTLATPFAPNFLLLDEPVANIDDLNVLALMDFLRELTITHGKQIFFTTANRNVAKLFRRKFSFLRENFQELYFLRENEHCLQISSRRYDQNRLWSDQTI